ncbi:MAG TPA: FMN-binding protein [bacterium]|nr:FMN-binding protein [bacterium]
MRKSVFWMTALGAPAALQVAHAEVYLTADQALALMFPGEKTKALTLELTPAETDQIQKSSGEPVDEKKLSLWKTADGGLMFVDQVVGKHDFITYALGLTPEGKVKDVEILEYKETFGKQVMEKGWRAQFAGKGSADPLTVGKDIKNYSGATLSSTHVTRGVKRLLQTYETIKNRLP